MNENPKNNTNSLLIIDDEEEVLKSLYRQFRKKYHVVTAKNTREAYEHMIREPFQVIISDQRMPEMTGTQFFNQIKYEYPDAIRLILTGYSDIQAVISAINQGNIFRYITKPWDPFELETIVNEAFRQYWLIVNNRHLMAQLKEANEKLEERVRRRTKDLIETNRKLETSNHEKDILLRQYEEEMRERKRTEKALRATRNSLNNIIMSSADGVIVVDENGLILFVNPAAEKLWSKPSHELVGTYFGYPVISNEKTEIEIIQQPGKTITVEPRSVKTTWEEKSVHLLALRDVSERKKTEEELKQAKIVAEIANRAKSDFLAHMSHEIRTPMNAIIGLMELTLDSPELTDKHRDNLLAIRDSSFHLLGIINEILDFSKIEAGKVQVEAIDFDLKKLLRSLIITFSVQTQKKGLYLTLNADDSVPRFIKSDPLRLRQIIVNLLGNAIRFTHEGGIELSVENISPRNRPRREEDTIPEGKNDPDIILRFSVRDTGIGISRERQESIFESYNQENASTSRQYGGTGLGLSISKRLVEIMGGQIGLESEKGKGSVFHFTIRCKTGDPSKINDLEKTTPKKIDPSPVSLNILLAEDNLLNQKMASRLLEKLGHRVEIAEDGEKTLELVSQKKFDLVLMDIQMPKMDGPQVARRIREGNSGNDMKDIPIIAMSAHSTTDYKNQCIQAGMNDYITKPISFEEISTKLNDIFK